MGDEKKYASIRIVDAAAAVRPSLPIRPWLPGMRKNTSRQAAIESLTNSPGFVREPDLFNILILNYTLKCPLACDYCCYKCSPKRHETMDVKLALDLVDQAAELGVFQQCGFTGGEPLIYYDEILQIAERMQKQSLPFSMISSCYWASTPVEARRVIGDLARLGMAVFSASHDPSHENWIPTQYIRNAIDAALEFGVHVCLCASFYDDSMRLERIFPEYQNNPELDYVNRVVLPDVGRVRPNKISPASYPNVAPSASLGSCYKRIYHDVTVFWDGETYPCCSVYNRQTPNLSLGNVYRDSLADIWTRAEGSLLLRTIKTGSFIELLEVVGRYDPSLIGQIPDPNSAVGPCHFCHLLFSDDALTGRIKAVMEQYEKQRIHDMLKAIKQLHGPGVEERVLVDALKPT